MSKKKKSSNQSLQELLSEDDKSKSPKNKQNKESSTSIKIQSSPENSNPSRSPEKSKAEKSDSKIKITIEDEKEAALPRLSIMNTDSETKIKPHKFNPQSLPIQTQLTMAQQELANSQKNNSKKTGHRRNDPILPIDFSVPNHNNVKSPSHPKTPNLQTTSRPNHNRKTSADKQTPDHMRDKIMFPNNNNLVSDQQSEYMMMPNFLGSLYTVANGHNPSAIETYYQQMAQNIPENYKQPITSHHIPQSARTLPNYRYANPYSSQTEPSPSKRKDESITKGRVKLKIDIDEMNIMSPKSMYRLGTDGGGGSASSSSAELRRMKYHPMTARAKIGEFVLKNLDEIEPDKSIVYPRPIEEPSPRYNRKKIVIKKSTALLFTNKAYPQTARGYEGEKILTEL